MKVLVARCDRLGDLVLSLPALAWLRRARPGWEIHAMVAPAAVPLIEHDPAVDAFYTWNLALSPQLLPQLEREGYDAAVLLQYQRPLAQLLRDAGVRRRYGPLSKLSSLVLLNRGQWQRRSRVARHESEFNLDLVRRLAGRGASAPTEPPRVHVSAAQRDLGRRFRAAEAPDATTLAFVHPGSGGSALDWPPERFAEMANTLSRQPGWRVFITGSHHDRLVIDALAPALDPAVSVVAERFPLRDLLGVLAAGDVLVAPSTGPLHVAAALGLAAVGVYPPAPTMSPARWGVLGPWSASITPPVKCPARRHCLLAHCMLYNCLEGVVPSRVVDIAVDLAARRHRERGASREASSRGETTS